MNFINYISEMLQLAQQGNPQGIFFLLASLALIIGLNTLFLQKKICRWPYAEGKLTGVTIEKKGPIEYFAELPSYELDSVDESVTLYQYTIEGETFPGKRVSPWIIVPSHHLGFLLNMRVYAIERLSDDTIKVFYNPKNPGKSYLIKPGIKSQFLTFLATILPMLFYSLNY